MEDEHVALLDGEALGVVADAPAASMMERNMRVAGKRKHSAQVK